MKISAKSRRQFKSVPLGTLNKHELEVCFLDIGTDADPISEELATFAGHSCLKTNQSNAYFAEQVVRKSSLTVICAVTASVDSRGRCDADVNKKYLLNPLNAWPIGPWMEVKLAAERLYLGAGLSHYVNTFTLPSVGRVEHAEGTGEPAQALDGINYLLGVLSGLECAKRTSSSRNSWRDSVSAFGW